MASFLLHLRFTLSSRLVMEEPGCKTPAFLERVDSELESLWQLQLCLGALLDRVGTQSWLRTEGWHLEGEIWGSRSFLKGGGRGSLPRVPHAAVSCFTAAWDQPWE